MTDYRQRGLDALANLDPTMGAYSGQSSPVAPEIYDLMMEYGIGMIWARPGLSPRDRSLLTIGMLIALRAEDQLRGHIPIGLTHGLTREEIAEILYHSTLYAGYPAAMTAHKVALDVMAK